MMTCLNQRVYSLGFLSQSTKEPWLGVRADMGRPPSHVAHILEDD